MLKFDPRWRFTPPKNGKYKNSSIPAAALREFLGLVEKTAVHGDRWDILEAFKSAFAGACGVSCMRSSSESWAASDMSSHASDAAKNAPLFIDAFHSACEKLRGDDLFTPDAHMISELCKKHRIGYRIEGGRLLLREGVAEDSVGEIERPPSLAEAAMEQLERSWQRSEKLLADDEPMEAVGALLWVLESLSTAFRDTKGGVRGKYFNEILQDLKRRERDSTFERVLDWIEKLHGYLSSPTGGGVRHGMDLKKGRKLTPAEGRLFCNLIRSYVGYLLSEHERLQREDSGD